MRCILEVEDDDATALLFRTALRETDSRVCCQRCGDADAARLILDNVGRDASNPPPGLILLDLNLPRTNGLQLLEYISQLPAVRSIPVVVFTSSGAPQDRKRAFELGAAAYVMKPETFDDYLVLVQQLLAMMS